MGRCVIQEHSVTFSFLYLQQRNVPPTNEKVTPFVCINFSAEVFLTFFFFLLRTSIWSAANGIHGFAGFCTWKLELGHWD